MNMMKAVEDSYKIISFINRKFTRMLGNDSANISTSGALVCTGKITNEFEEYRDESNPNIHMAFVRYIVSSFISSRAQYSMDSLSISILREAINDIHREEPAKVLNYIYKDQDRANKLINEIVNDLTFHGKNVKERKVK